MEYKPYFLSEEILKNNILNEYNLCSSVIEQIKFKDTDKQRAVYKITNESNCYCLKKIYYSESELLFVYSVIEWLYRYNLNVPRIIPTKHGDRFAKYNNMLFILSPWIEGEKCNYDNSSHLLASAENLAIMHYNTSNFFPINGSDIRRGYDNINYSITKHFRDLLNFSNLSHKYNDDFSNIYDKNFDICIELAKNSLELSCKINNINLSKGLCHLDYVNKNIIFDNSKKLWIIDFDKCKQDYCVHDISYFSRRFMKRENTKWDINLYKACLQKYDNIKPLTKDEHNYILSYLSFPQKYWKISRDYYNNINKCNKASFVFLLQKAVKNIDLQLTFSNTLMNYIDEKFE